MTYLAIPIAAADLEQAAGQIKAALAGRAEMLELRTDYLENLNVDLVKNLIAKTKTAAGKSIPIIVTCRAKGQGSAIGYPDRLRVDVLAGALKAGVEFIDFEYESFLTTENQERIKLALSENSKARLIMSAHNFKTKFTDIGKLYRHILTLYPAAIPKLVYTANHINDCFEAFDLLHNTSGERIIFCMGEASLVSRIIAKKLGSFVTFASIDDKTATAPGQLTVEQLKTLYRWGDIDADTELYGVIADPVAHSASPAVHNTCFTSMDINKLYLPLLVEGGKEEFAQFLHNILVRNWLGFRGFSVTIPHKVNALSFAKENNGRIEQLAKRIGAVNTLLIEPRATNHEPQISGYNTDYAGALDAVTSTLKIARADLKDLPVAVIGAGGVARAIVAGLRDVGAKVKIYNRTVRKAEGLAVEFDCDFAGLDDLPNLDAKLIINCTSIGMHPNIDKTPLPKECLKKNITVFDTVYNPAETLLLKQAKEIGCKTIDGLSMFISQAIVQFKFFTGQNANAKLMRKAISNCL